MAEIKKFLDTNGVKHLWSKISDKFAVDAELKAVAKSGAASDVAITDAGNLITATNVEAALQEIVTNLNSASNAAVITVEKDTTGDYAAQYTFKQGGTAISGGVITIAKDMVATSGEYVNQNAAGTAGHFIKMTIANGEAFYINVADLVEWNTFNDDDPMIHVVDNSHAISISLKDASITKAKLDAGVKASLELADSALQEANIETGTANGKIKVGNKEVPVYGLGSAAYTDTSAYDAAGAAAAVLGVSTDAATANTVFGAKAYADTIYAAIQNLSDAEIDSAIAAAEAAPQA